MKFEQSISFSGIWGTVTTNLPSKYQIKQILVIRDLLDTYWKMWAVWTVDCVKQ